MIFRMNNKKGEGPVAHLVERLVCTEEVAGSSPVRSTEKLKFIMQKDITQKNDEQLVAQYLAGDEKSLEILIKKYLKPVHAFVFHYVGNQSETEDIVQEVFVKVWKNIGKFDQTRIFKTWLFAIAKNTSIDFFKKKKAVPFSSFENAEGDNVLLDSIKDLSPLPDEILEQSELKKTIDSAIGMLGEKYREIFFLRNDLSLTFREIAAKTGEPLNTVKSRYRRALSVVRGFLS